MWPLPGLYFTEMAALSMLSAFVVISGDPRSPFITWGTAGIMSGFSILGSLSVGFFYLPIALIFFVISLTSDLRNGRRIGPHVVLFLLAGITQCALMIAAIPWHRPGAGF